MVFCGIWGICLASIFCYLSQMIYKFIDVRKFCRIKYNWIKIIPNIAMFTIQVIFMSIEKYSLTVIANIVAIVLCIINCEDILKMTRKLRCKF